MQIKTASGYITTASTVSGLTSVAASATSVALSAASNDRVLWSVFNDSSVIMYLAWGATASATAFTTKVQPQALYELPGGQHPYVGAISAVWASADGGFARITSAS